MPNEKHPELVAAPDDWWSENVKLFHDLLRRKAASRQQPKPAPAPEPMIKPARSPPTPVQDDPRDAEIRRSDLARAEWARSQFANTGN